MAASVTESVVVRRRVEEVAPVATRPEVVLPIMGGLGRFDLVSQEPDGSEVWDMFLDVSTIHVGGRVVVRTLDDRTLVWRAVRGTRHDVRLDVEPLGPDTRLQLTMTLELASGLLAGRIVELLSHGIMRRHLQAGLEQLRHHLEYELD